MSASTPGPWVVAQGSMGMLSISTIREGKSWFIADVRGRYVHLTADGPVTDDRTDEAVANARLIAAAPDLLAACIKTIEENLHLADGENCTLIDLKRAIALAEGK